MKKTKLTSEKSPEIAEAIDALEQLEAYFGAKAKKVKKIKEQAALDPDFVDEIPTGVVAPVQLEQKP